MPPALRFGKYVIDGLLGPGGVTETYLAHVEHDSQRPKGARKSQTIFALKLLRPDRIAPTSLSTAIGRFTVAGQQLRDFHRPGFARVFEVCANPEACFIVSEHVPGHDLGRLVDAIQAEGPGNAGMDPGLVGLVGSEIARLLHVGHSAKPYFCHLGLSPANVAVLPTGEVILLDAGVAASLRAITEQPPDRWSFVAPELHQVDVLVHPPSQRRAIAADLWSLGAILHFVLTGQTPKPGSTPGVESGWGQDLPELPGKLKAALRTLLAVDPDERPESAALLVDWLSDGVRSTRERRHLIADRVRTLEAAVHPGAEPDGAISPSGLAADGPDLVGGQAGRLDFRIVTSAGKAHGLRWWWLGIVIACAGSAIVLFATLAGSPVKPDSGVRMADPVASMVASRPSELGRAGAAAEPTSAGRQDPSRVMLSRMAGRLIVETIPPGASVWVDGVFKGKTFLDVVVGDGQHDVDLIVAGHRMYRQSVPTGQGAIIRRTLAAIVPDAASRARVRVRCATFGLYPILVDDQETGLFCPSTVRVAPGRHMIGIYIPQRRKTLSVEASASGEGVPAQVTFAE